MLRLNQIKLHPNHSQNELDNQIKKELHLPKESKVEYVIAKKSIDARHKPEIWYIYSVDIKAVIISGKCLSDEKVIKQSRNRNLVLSKQIQYKFPYKATSEGINEALRPVIIGFGPAGMFAALELSKAGFCPIVYERGSNVDERHDIVEKFWATGMLDCETNVQFGEGGAGTFSDGKLNTGVKDSYGRIRETLEMFVSFGADSSILYNNKPHIGTDVLRKVVKNIRNYIISLGGEVHFNTRLDKLITTNNQITGIELTNLKSNQKVIRNCRLVCMAIGHSARDTFKMLNDINCEMQPKAFAVGVRIEHPQSMINEYAYGNAPYELPTADYKVTAQTKMQRGVYSFCMCPGGYVVNASSEKLRTAVNGMSYSGRNSSNANSAIIVTVTPKDFGEGVLDGMIFQQALEEKAYEAANGKIPVQLFGDFCTGKSSTGFGAFMPCIKGEYAFADFNTILPEFISLSIKEGIYDFGKRIKGFDREDAILSGVETRTSSPIRIVRNESLESQIKGLYPCGEGAGYAGGITSAAVDGIKVAERIALRHINA